MNRRRFLGTLALGTSTGAAGCLGVLSGGGNPDVSGSDTVTSGGVGRSTSPTDDVIDSLAEAGFPANICTEEIEDDFGIDAITDPVFAADWSGVDVAAKYFFRDTTELTDEQTVIGLEGEPPRAYPLSVLWVHEIVNDFLGGPVLVTHCPLCQSGVVAERTVDGEPTVFGVSGLLWQAPRVYEAASEAEGRVFGAARGNRTGVSVRNSGNLVMYDVATRSYWSQILARAICGPQTGRTLSILPSTFTSWGAWRAEHPDTQVLLPPPHSKTI